MLHTLLNKNTMQKQPIKFRKVFTSIACSPLIFVSNNSELAAKYLPSDVKKSHNNLQTHNLQSSFLSSFEDTQNKKFLIDLKIIITHHH